MKNNFVGWLTCFFMLLSGAGSLMSMDYVRPPKRLLDEIRHEVVFAAILRRSADGAVFHRVLRGDESLTGKKIDKALVTGDLEFGRSLDLKYLFVILGREEGKVSSKFKLTEKVSVESNWIISGWTNPKGEVSAKFKDGRWELTLVQLFGKNGALNDGDKFFVK